MNAREKRLLLWLGIAAGIAMLARQQPAKIAERTTTMIRSAAEQFRDMTLPRGVRNNNPGNLRISNNAWKGKVPVAQNSDRTFEQFVEYNGLPGHIWGLRAMYIDLRGDVLKDGLDTLRKLITSYAPESDNNNTDAYIASVSRAIGKSADAILVASDIPKMMPPMIAVENRGYRYPANDIATAISLA